MSEQRAPSGRLLTRMERSGRYVLDPDTELRYLNAAYVENHRTPPRQLWWCEVCRDGWRTPAARDGHVCPGPPR